MEKKNEKDENNVQLWNEKGKGTTKTNTKTIGSRKPSKKTKGGWFHGWRGRVSLSGCAPGPGSVYWWQCNKDESPAAGQIDADRDPR